MSKHRVPITTVTLPRQLREDFFSLPEHMRQRYKNFSDYATEKIRLALQEDRFIASRIEEVHELPEESDQARQ